MPDNILLLQGPVGPFFQRFANELEQHGHTVFKINFNGGDKLFYRKPGSVSYTGKPAEWSQYLENFINQNRIDRVYVFGDCRSYHQTAREICEHSGKRFFVFEEGYLRPDYVTLEENGVNGHSNINFCYSDTLTPLRKIEEEPVHFNHVFAFTAFYAVLYYMASSLLRWKFPHYIHHRPLNTFSEGSKWLFSFFKRFHTSRRDARISQHLVNDCRNQFFLVPLQVHSDMQVKMHSGFPDVVNFIETTLESFARSSSKKQCLVFKHHPMDRAYRDYQTFITETARKLGISGRVYYIFDGHLPTLMKYALGTVTINSTVGLSSLFHGVPVIALGDAIYNVDKLSFQGSLDEFWRADIKVNAKIYNTFKNYLLDGNQLNGNFYRRAAQSGHSTGLKWSPYLGVSHLGNPQVNIKNAETIQLNEKAA